MSISEKELERRLIDAGNRLLSPPSSVTELLNSLDLVENLLAGVEQSPSGSMKAALAPSTKALITNELLRHSDVDVKVAVASCISEITRITAPDAPYGDEQMKEVFQLIVSSFANLDDKSSRSYTKRTSILDTVAKVRSCVVMLDLECDALIVEMFRHFFKTIRDDHPVDIFSSMETIMTLVIEESEDVSVDLLSTILDVLKNDNKEVHPIACQLGEKVVVSCAIKLKPFLIPAVRSSGASLADYNKAVADVIYPAGGEAVEPTTNDASKPNLADDENLINPSSEKAVEVAMKTLQGSPPTDVVGPTTIESSKAVVSNGILQKGNEESSAANDTSRGADHDTQDEKGEPSKTIADSVNVPAPTKSKKKPKKAKKRKGKKTNSSKKSSKPLEPVESNIETEVIDTPECQDDPMNVDNLENEGPAVDITDASDHEKASDALIASPETTNNERPDVSLPSPGGSLADESHSKKAKQGKLKDDTIQEGETAHSVDSGKESDTEKDSEEPTGSKKKLNKHSSKNSPSTSDHEESAPDSADDSKKEADSTHEVDDIPPKDLAKETEVGSQLADKKKRGQSKATPSTEKRKTPAKNEKKKASTLPKSTPKVTKDESDVEEASRPSSKRKRMSEEKTPQANDYGQELVGATVKVWWPDDKAFYQGVIDSFDDSEMKHKILYIDGDVEILNLKKEKWRLIAPPKEHASDDGESPDESADETPKGKKTKTNADVGSKQGKSASLSKKSVSSSSKPKASPKFASNSKEEPTKKVGKSDANKGGRSKTIKSAKKSKEDDSDDEDTPLGNIKSKQDTAKSTAKSKGKSPKTVVGKSISSAKGKGSKSAKDEDESEDESIELEESPEKSKTKSKSKSPKSVVGKSITSTKSAKGKGSTSAKDDDEIEDESIVLEKSPEKSRTKSKSTPPKSQNSMKKRKR